MPAMIAPVFNTVSKKRAEAVTGAPVTASWSAWTSVNPASCATIQDATTSEGGKYQPRSVANCVTTAAGKTAMKPPRKFW